MNKRAFTRLIAKLVLEMCMAGDQAILYCTGRSAEQQNIYFKQGKSKCDGYLIKSRHQDLLAADIYLADENGIQWEWDKEKAIKWHNRWMELSGSTSWLEWDAPHFSSDGK